MSAVIGLKMKQNMWRTDMASLTDEEIKKDFERFLRHESMRAYVPQDKVLELIKEVIWTD